MGMFTSIVHPEDGRELQIKTGHDFCDRYKVGDIVDWCIDKDNPGTGKLFDGVYPSYSDRGDDNFVIIKDHRIHSVIPRSSLVCSEKCFCDHIKNDFDIIPFQRSWWSEDAWLRKDIKDVECTLNFANEKLTFLQSLVGKSEQEIKNSRENFVFSSLVNPIKCMMSYAGLARQIFTANKQ